MHTDIRIILVEDNPQYREIIELALSNEDGMRLIEKFGAAEVALDYLQNPKNAAQIDIILLDINLPSMSGVEAIHSFRHSNPDTPIIMLTQSNKEADVVQAIRVGAAGYLLKSSSIEEITKSIRVVLEGGAPLDPGVAKYLMHTLSNQQESRQSKVTLTNRENQIIELMSEGLQKKEISDRLSISTHTVAEHVKRIYAKLEAPNAPAAIAKAYKSGLLKDS